MAIKARYRGDGSEFLNGVPARDVDEEEYAGLTAEQWVLMISSGLYELVKPAIAEAPPKKGGGDG